MSDAVDNREYMECDCKVYVEVTADFKPDGTIYPRSFKWEDGNRYEIDRILDMRRAASLKAGGTGLRYKVRVRHRETFMFLEDGSGTFRWFMERR